MASYRGARIGQREASFEDVVRELSVSALDAFFDNLKDEDCLTSVRLVCRALRNAVDGSARELRFRVDNDVGDQWKAGQLPSLSRWPRCTSVRLVHAVQVTDQLADSSARLLLLPFSGMSLNARQRITHLTISEEKKRPLLSATSVVALIAQRLPGLRELKLHRLSIMPADRLNLCAMYDSLQASLPHLELLTLPSYRALKSIEILAGDNLKHVEAYCYHDYAPLNFKILDSLAQLDGLRKLSLYQCELSPSAHHVVSRCSLQQLLASLPASVQHLQLYDCGRTSLATPFNAAIAVKLRRIISLDLSFEKHLTTTSLLLMLRKQ
ncbi:hypothetical protein Agub_g8147, partial [Astrephomene gubernaculifera]